MTDHQMSNIKAAEQADFEREQAIATMIDSNLQFIAEYWQIGDGEGAALIFKIVEALRAAGYPAACTYYDEFHQIAVEAKPENKARISAEVRTMVMERDLYRCVVCGTHKDLTIDHIHPKSRGGGADPGNLQTLCRACNARKGARHPGGGA